MIPLLQELLFGTFVPPKTSGPTIKHSICGSSNRKKPTLKSARDVVFAAANTPVWKTNKQIVEETQLLFNCVQRHTLRLFEAGKIQRCVRDNPEDIKAVYMYRMNDENVGKRD